MTIINSLKNISNNIYSKVSDLFTIEVEDVIESIDKIEEVITLDITTDGDHLFYANNILTHNCAVESSEYDHSHIAGGISKIMTADNVIGIFNTMAMRERSEIQFQFLKTRNSNGVGMKVALGFDIDTLKITDHPDSTGSFVPSASNSTQNLMSNTMINNQNKSTEINTTSNDSIDPVQTTGGTSELRRLLGNSLR